MQFGLLAELIAQNQDNIALLEERYAINENEIAAVEVDINENTANVDQLVTEVLNVTNVLEEFAISLIEQAAQLAFIASFDSQVTEIVRNATNVVTILNSNFIGNGSAISNTTANATCPPNYDLLSAGCSLVLPGITVADTIDFISDPDSYITGNVSRFLWDTVYPACPLRRLLNMWQCPCRGHTDRSP